MTEQVEFMAGDTTQPLDIDITLDTFEEADEQFQVYLHDPDTGEALGDMHKGIVTIFDDDGVSCKYTNITS